MAQRSARRRGRGGTLRITLRPCEKARNVSRYTIAARMLLSDVSLPPLAPTAPPEASGPTRSPGVRAAPAGVEEAFYRGPGWICGRLAEVACSRAGDAYVVRIAGLPPLLIDERGCTVLPESGEPATASDQLVEAALGPGLILPLALAGVFTLHAAAVERNGAAVLVLGDSGAGKSTLGRALAARPGWSQLADDALPVEASRDGLVALPHFPQLKLPTAMQYGAARAEWLPVRAIVALAPGGQGAVAMTPLGPREGFLALARHTVAARLFDAPLLVGHGAFCDAATTDVGLHRLAFPQRLEALPDMIDAIAALVSTEG